MLSTFCLLPILGAFILLFFGKQNVKAARFFALFWSLLIFDLSVLLFLFFDPVIPHFQYIEEIYWLSFSNNNIVLGIDGISLSLIILTTFLTPICILLAWNSSLLYTTREYSAAFLVLESILLGVFCCLDLLWFYILFEAVLLPMYFIVGLYGSRERRIKASYYLFLYTLASSVLMLIAILFLYFKTGTTDFQILKTITLEPFEEKLCWLAFFSSFAVKMPLVPFHIWLPEAHCEAPTAGSVILAGILLKLGGYGFLRFSLGLFPSASAEFSPLIFMICILGVIYASLTTLQQGDLKKIIAYSSVGHMAIVTVGIFSLNIPGLLGSILLMISHGIVSGALFLTVGFIYERHHTRIVKYYGGLIHTMPLFSVFFILFTMGNLGLPGTSSFIGEFLVLVGCFEINTWVALLSSLGMVFGAGYSLWLCNRILFGNIKRYYISSFRDLTKLEFMILLPFGFLTILLGLLPGFLINLINSSLLYVIV